MCCSRFIFLLLTVKSFLIIAFKRVSCILHILLIYYFFRICMHFINDKQVNLCQSILVKRKNKSFFFFFIHHEVSQQIFISILLSLALHSFPDAFLISPALEYRLKQYNGPSPSTFQ